MNARQITYDAIASQLSWPDAINALKAGHMRPKASTGDIVLGPPTGALVSRAAWIEGLGYGVKSFSVVEGNAERGIPTVQGAMFVFDPHHGSIEAIIESRLVTEFKTAADSVLGASYLARPDSRHLLIVGAGDVARSLIRAYPALFPQLEKVSIWARRKSQSSALARQFEADPLNVVAVSDLAAAASSADIIATATLAQEPVLKGEWVMPGTHVDLIGAFRPNMREADDALISAGNVYVDSRETTIGYNGELDIPIAKGVIESSSVIGDLYDLIRGDVEGRRSEDEVTLFKNAGGAHLDLMISHYISSVFGP
ncbi:ornithine cyclodeaminase [uncultured Roseobacter sp.]|uniref:ornithine cyclodeaminase family protein n=1 Tax=uncultured Roseobacter sp. TaxID=114847 RepID=UPI0026024AEC|nr:ornithine cyclodeaminase [uncultured Roseobacter sp.]